ncbi:hypothetical protein [Campylobacter armoricus]|uniref:hypothetical protein n=1 Tax=Campylobacter armoricus TaxID=2505970 RepID=UPI001116B47D|nr:hypothetical protein [Campylobacter armoricus]EKB0719237.1 hypothetical protein [Campylobacter jejuni]ELD5362486.1 hypothetical protein [Campylobacter coli]ELU1045510.1 hypothetical protein [Campylobacter coli]
MIKAYFENNAINVKAFARTHNINYDILHRVIKGEITGQRNTKGATKVVFEKLLELNIINELPQGLK